MRLVISGFGVMGERLLRGAVDHPGVIISGVWDPSPAAIERLSAEFPKVPIKGSFETLLEDSDCLYIAAPPKAHIPAIEAAFAAGLAVFCEKPLAVDTEAATRLVDRSEAQKLRAAVNFPFATSQGVEALGEWLRAGKIGIPERLEIDLAFATWPRSWQKDAAGWLTGRAEGGFTREVGSHFLFLSRRLLGPLSLLSSSVDYPADGSEVGIAADIRAGGLPVRFTGSVGKTDLDDSNQWRLIGTKGEMRLRNWSHADYRVEGEDWIAAPSMPVEKMRPISVKRQLDALIEAAGGRPHPLATLREALDVQLIVEAILAS
ncbi:Gfo/Idh/MocA family protein [Lacibacterium aquatile]|uniref:Gfo/Idh/MocA family protein n=1 Tax=Lacibacterium aquatile TaxID=1168082 RepID=A0ABW5DWP8_9PROT